MSPKVKHCADILASELEQVEAFDNEDPAKLCQFQHIILDTCVRVRDDINNHGVNTWFLLYIDLALQQIYPGFVVMYATVRSFSRCLYLMLPSRKGQNLCIVMWEAEIAART